jgi:hypothetical protein
VLGGDSGEYQVAAWLGGFVHPTGYPLYLIVGWLWTHLLPVGSPAWRMNLLTAFCAALAVGLVYLLAARVLAASAAARLSSTARRMLALFAALCFAIAPTFWSQAIIAESYPLHAAFVAAVLLCLLVWAERPDARTLYWAAGLYGLSLTHHRTMLLLAPASLAFLWQNRAKIRLQSLSPVRIAGLLLVPLALYLYIPLRAPRAPYSQVALSPTQTLHLYLPTVSGFVEYVSGRVFSAALHTLVQALEVAPQAGAFFVHEFSWIGVGLGLLGLLWLVVRRRWGVLTLTGLSFFCLVAFNMFYGIPNIWVYFIAPYLIWVLWMALGLAVLAEVVTRLVRG